MEGDIEQKQAYLRREILERQFDAQDFVDFMNARLSIGDNLSLCSIEQLKEVVASYVKSKSAEASRVLGAVNEINSSVKNVGRRQVFFEKYSMAQEQFYKIYQCLKFADKHEGRRLHCEVYDPQRKTTGGIFGFATTSFLEFQVRTVEFNWVVGRRYSDFIWLRVYLQKVFPTSILPPIPNKKAAKRTQRDLDKRMSILQYFLNDLLALPEWRANRIVQGFLKITDPVKLQALKEEAEKVNLIEGVSQVQSINGTVPIRLSPENYGCFRQMEKVIPEIQRIYKQITRQGKALQNLYTQEVNGLYEMGNLFAELHEYSTKVLKVAPALDGLAKLDSIFVALNNMSIEWGNQIRNQYAFLEKNFNTFFKYVRNELHGYKEIFEAEVLAEEAFAKAFLALQKRKEKTYNCFDSSRWQLDKDVLSSVTKEMVRNKEQAWKLMHPNDSEEVERLRLSCYLYISQFETRANYNLQRSAQKFQEDFKEFTINIKVNTQQLNELWSEMGKNFSGQFKHKQVRKESSMDTQLLDRIVED